MCMRMHMHMYVHEYIVPSGTIAPVSAVLYALSMDRLPPTLRLRIRILRSILFSKDFLDI